MNQAFRQFVRDRASRRCEYCGLSEDDDFVLSFHVEHIRARQHGGDDDEGNLALACHHCNLHKGPNLSGVDPQTDRIVELFHPRRDRWSDHFNQTDGMIKGNTAAGRATVVVLAMNQADRVELRRSMQ
jgi:hypothetical protein